MSKIIKVWCEDCKGGGALYEGGGMSMCPLCEGRGWSPLSEVVKGHAASRELIDYNEAMKARMVPYRVRNHIAGVQVRMKKIGPEPKYHSDLIDDSVVREVAKQLDQEPPQSRSAVKPTPIGTTKYGPDGWYLDLPCTCDAGCDLVCTGYECGCMACTKCHFDSVKNKESKPPKISDESKEEFSGLRACFQQFFKEEFKRGFDEYCDQFWPNGQPVPRKPKQADES